jgi:cytoskeletal protein CcmA (bactofilin family)
MRRAPLIVGLAAVFVLGLAIPASAGPGDGVGSRIVIVGGVDVPAGKTVDTVFVVRGPVTVEGTVTGSVVSIDGQVTISGHVEGDVVAIDGPVELTDGARIDGDLASRLTPKVASGATVSGSIRGINTQLTVGGLFAARFAFWVAASISILILGLLLLAFVPRAGAALLVTMSASTGASIGAGFLVFLGLPVISILAIATLVGIPLGLGILLALMPIYTVGYVVSVWLVGRQIIRAPSSPFLAFLVGWVILRVLALVPFLGGLLWFAGAVFGLGVLVVSARRVGRPRERREAVPIPPAPV